MVKSSFLLQLGLYLCEKCSNGLDDAMLLNSDSVVHYLLQRGFLSFDSAVEGDLMVLEAPRRNRNFKVMLRRYPGLFVKQAQQWDSNAISTLRREAWCYSLAKTVPEFAPLLNLLPKFYWYDPVRHVLVLELLSSYENLAAYLPRMGVFPVEIAEALAEILGRYHLSTRGKLKSLPQASIFPKTKPWALSMHRQQVEWFPSFSAANSQLLEIVKKYDQFTATLDELIKGWNHDSLIHGDIKWDNCLIRPAGGSQTRPGLKLIDWELADLGDALWDVGAILQSYISHWINSMPTSPGATTEELMARAPYQLEVFHPAITAFWRRYAEVAEIPPTRRKESLDRSVRYGAARMLQTAYESLSFSTQVHSNALYLLQVSMNILLNPEEAAEQLFGIAEA
jgi:phosphotransferase family enzyme